MGTIYQFGEFRFSGEKGLLRGSVPVPLAPRVSALLHRLLQADGATISKEVVINVCVPGAVNVDAALARTLHLLRKALDDRGHNIVRTNYGRGISLGVPVSQSPADHAAGAGHITSSGQPLAATGEEMIRTAFELASSRSQQSLALAGSVLAHAFERFPKLALAPSLHADVLVSTMIRGYARPAVQAKRALDLVGNALGVVPHLPSALATKGWLVGVTLGDQASGLRLIDQAISAAPNLWIARLYKAWLLMGEGSLDDATAVLEEGLCISPLERGLLALKGLTLCARGLVDEALSFTDFALGHRPDVDLLWIVQAIGRVQGQDFKGARQSIARAVSLSPQDTYIQANEAWVLATTGQPEAGLDFLNRRAKSPGYVLPVALAMVRAAICDKVGADNLLRIAEVDKDPWRLLVRCDPRLRNSNGHFVKSEKISATTKDTRCAIC